MTTEKKKKGCISYSLYFSLFLTALLAIYKFSEADDCSWLFVFSPLCIWGSCVLVFVFVCFLFALHAVREDKK